MLKFYHCGDERTLFSFHGIKLFYIKRNYCTNVSVHLELSANI